jgi:hypothetical protein
MIKRQDWTVTFDNGSTAHYFNTTALGAVRAAVKDWYPAKRVVAWAPYQEAVDVYSIPLD